MTRRFTRLRGGLRVGADWFAREGVLVPSEAAPRGLVDSLEELSNPDVDVSRVHPDVRVFFEDTASLELHVESTWRFPFGLAWRLARPLFRAVGQLVLPEREARIRTRLFAMARERDGREGARAVVREYTSGGVMQAVAYATSRRGDTRFMNAAFLLPGGHLTGILRLESIGEDDDGRLAVAVTSRGRRGDGAGIWLVLFGLAVPLPLSERLELWPRRMRGAPRELDRAPIEGATLVGRHEQRLFGVPVVTHHYWFAPVPRRAS